MKTPVNRRSAHQLKMLRKAFKRKFGRDPGPDDPVFFDPNSDTPDAIDQSEISSGVLSAMKSAGLAPELIYAYRKTGRLIMEGERYPPGAVEEWQAAIDEYFELEAKAKPRTE